MIYTLPVRLEDGQNVQKHLVSEKLLNGNVTQRHQQKAA